MSKTFDIGIESLTGDADPPACGTTVSLGLLPLPPLAAARATSQGEHICERDREVLLHRDLRLPDERARQRKSCRRAPRERLSPRRILAQADLVLYNTCSIREKAAQKVFARFGDWKTLCAWQNHRRLWAAWPSKKAKKFSNALRGSAWSAAPPAIANSPQLIAQLESGGRRVTGLDLDTDETFETEITRRDNPLRAYITIIEGCDYACSYCVVPHTRGPERSRASEAVLAEARAPRRRRLH